MNGTIKTEIAELSVLNITIQKKRKKRQSYMKRRK